MALRTLRILGLTFLAFILIAAGTMACKGSKEKGAEEQAVNVQQGHMDFEGTVKIGVGKYMFVPEVRGFDIVVQGGLESGTLDDLAGKEIKGSGEYTPERPSILVADSLEVKNESGEWTAAFTRTEDVVLDDFLSVADRDGFEVLKTLNYSKKEGWEGKEKVRVYGKLEGEEGSAKIVVMDDKGKEAGRIDVDSLSDFARYYMKKLRLFSDFWFYLKVKETVEWKTRRRTRELFHADVVFAGLF